MLSAFLQRLGFRVPQPFCPLGILLFPPATKASEWFSVALAGPSPEGAGGAAASQDFSRVPWKNRVLKSYAQESDPKVIEAIDRVRQHPAVLGDCELARTLVHGTGSHCKAAQIIPGVVKYKGRKAALPGSGESKQDPAAEAMMMHSWRQRTRRLTW